MGGMAGMRRSMAASGGIHGIAGGIGRGSVRHSGLVGTSARTSARTSATHISPAHSAVDSRDLSSVANRRRSDGIGFGGSDGGLGGDIASRLAELGRRAEAIEQEGNLSPAREAAQENRELALLGGRRQSGHL